MCSRVLRVRGQAEDSGLQDRGQWASKAEFLLAVAGQIIGLGNVWRFPYLCYKNGGGVFFVPYMLFLVVCGIPLFLLETALGQYTSLGGVSAWMKICPLFAGLGFASQMMILHSCVYYIVILAWAFFYLCSSFQMRLPWSHCNNTWNTDSCRGFDRHNMSDLSENATSPVIEFWEHEVLGLSASVDRLGSVNWRLALCLLLVWTVCYFCVWKGVKSTGKAVYVTATFPYVMLLVLLVRGVSLPGAVDGIVYYLKPNHTRLTDPQVWMDAGTQIFFSYGICLGSLTALGSYNKFNNDCYKDCFRLCLLNSSTSFIAGFAIFSMLGFMAQEQGVDIADVVESGPGLAFIAYPRAVSMMPLPQLWAVCFFLMILMLGLDTQVFIPAHSDLYHLIMKMSVLLSSSPLFVCVQGGLYVFQIYDHFSCSGASLLLLSVCQSVAIGWIYGADRFSNNIKAMIGYQPLCIFSLCWRYLTPAVCIGTFGFSLMFWSPLTLANGVTAPRWARAMGWMLTLSSVSLLPLCAIYSLMNTPGTLQQVQKKKPLYHNIAMICRTRSAIIKNLLQICLEEDMCLYCLRLHLHCRS
uniref:Transporter n=1 Tax=Cyprinus carpio TaxID=7962 RepID=A0A8C1UFJ2_CYPCA